MDIFDYWRLNEDFSLSEAAMLMIGANPQDLDRLYSYQHELKQFEENQNASEAGFDVDVIKPSVPNYDQKPSEWKERYDVIIKTLSKAVAQGRLQAEKKMIQMPSWDTTGECYFDRDTDEIDINKTIVHIDDLKDWLKSRGISMGFFFPGAEQNAVQDYLNPTHKHYARKLAAAVNAWLVVSSNPDLRKNKTPKQAIDIWLRKNADNYGLTKDDGNLNEQGIEEISKVANWKSGGNCKINY